VALDEGYFKEVGVDIDIVGLFRAGPEIMSAFSAGAVDMAYVGEAPTVTAFANGTAKIKILAQVNTEGSAIVVSRNSAIKSVRDLRTKVVAIPGYSTVQDCLLHKALGKYHISLKDVQITVIRPPEMISALRMGQIDAFVAWEPVPSQAIGMGVGDILATSGSIWPDHPCCVLVVDAILAKKHPDKLRRILRAHQKAVAFILSKPREAAVIAVKHTGMSAQVVKMAMENVKYVSDLNIEGLRDYIKYLKRLGYVDVKDVEALIAHLVNRPEE
ncbi:MAG: ABC transporter substrate-binding protein, partial [Desulfomonilaceae bacterium]